MTASVVISISYGNSSEAAFEHTRHFTTFDGEIPNKALAKAIADTISNQLLEGGVFGLYKEEFPLAAGVNLAKPS